jgi:hypothetical protein
LENNWAYSEREVYICLDEI